MALSESNLFPLVGYPFRELMGQLPLGGLSTYTAPIETLAALNSVVQPLIAPTLPGQRGYLPLAGYPPMWNPHAYPYLAPNWYPPQGQMLYPGGPIGYSGTQPSLAGSTTGNTNSVTSSPYYGVL
ncbi:hypothetical protein ECG_03270 [Echinococcus granulosus]|nr:hypothetical protein ECG_03270 [Echinococcus granulosus]